MLSKTFFMVFASVLFFALGCSENIVSNDQSSVQETTAVTDFAKESALISTREIRNNDSKANGLTIVDIAAGNAAFSTLVSAVVKADLVDILSRKRMFTVFAPTNDAFDAAAEAVLGAGNTGEDLVEALNIEALTDILLYHVSPGERFSEDVVSAKRIRMMNKSFTFVDGTTIVGNNSSADLVLDLIDIDASNGVIHVIDFVLLP